MSWSSKLRAISSCESSEGRSTGGVQVPGGVSMPSDSGGRSAIADAGEDPSSLLASVSLHQLPSALPLVNLLSIASARQNARQDIGIGSGSGV